VCGTYRLPLSKRSSDGALIEARGGAVSCSVAKDCPAAAAATAPFFSASGVVAQRCLSLAGKREIELARRCFRAHDPVRNFVALVALS